MVMRFDQQAPIFRAVAGFCVSHSTCRPYSVYLEGLNHITSNGTMRHVTCQRGEPCRTWLRRLLGRSNCQGYRNVLSKERIRKEGAPMRLSRVVPAALVAVLLAACASRPSPPPKEPSSISEQPTPPPESSGVPPTVRSSQGQSPIITLVKATVPPRTEPPSIRDVAFATPQRGWILLDGKALITTDGGQTWRPAALPQPFESVSFTGPQLGHATFQQLLFRTTDGGDTWAPVDTNGWPNPGAVFVDASHGWSSGWKQDTFYRTVDGGQSWEKMTDPCPTDSRRPFSFISPTSGWLLCGFDEGSGAMSKRLYRTEDGGHIWVLLGEALVGENREQSTAKEWPGGLSIDDYVGDLFFVDERHGWYTGARYGTFMATQDGGRTWGEVPGPSMRFSRVRFITRQVGYRYGLDTIQDSPWVLSMTSDGGETWMQVYPRRQPLQRFYLDGRTFIGELDGGLYLSEDAGESWRVLTELPAPLVSLSYTSREHAWALMGTDKERHLYRSTDGGVTWQRVSSAEGLDSYQHVQGLDARTAILWDNANRLLVTRDAGASFVPVAAPHDEFGGHGFYFTSADAGWFSRSFHLFTTVDGGKAWEAIPLPDHWKAQGVTVGPDGRLWASIVDVSDEYTPVLLTLASGDGGRTWTRYDLGDFNQPWPVYRCGLSSICVDSGGFRHGIVSHDGGQTWHYYQR
jgi:photosystem II stability/assembly factor-like uncharacterized protein